MFNNLRELIATMPDEETCRKYLELQRWDNKPVCPFCECSAYYVIDKGRRYKCSNNTCNMKYSVTTGTIFHASKVALNKWLNAVYVVSAHKKGISSYQLAKDIGVTQRTAWFMIHRIREAMRTKVNTALDTIVEVDETYVGGKMKNKHKSVRNKAHAENISHTDNKAAVMGYLQREGDLKLIPMDKDKTLKEQVQDNVKPEAVIVTDGLNAYKGLDKMFEGHEVVNHIEDEFVRGDFHTNGIEGAFGLFKRMVIGIYHQTSKKHLSRYCDEFTYRYNSRKMKDSERFVATLGKIQGGLTYKQLTGKQ
ncbi:MAG TPA: IS1595 family transposase [Panacibacter sp.]|nr:IS1595 family transposase [Panacibacter sp.]